MEGTDLSHSPENQKSIRHYFVDEAGDAILFDGKGRSIIGVTGCSRYFILGLLDVADPVAEYYTQKKPLTLAALNNRTGDIGAS